MEIKQNFAFHHITDVKLSIKQLKKELQYANDDFNADLDFETSDNYTLNAKQDKIQILVFNIEKKKKQLSDMILSLSN